ncbi:MAG: DUF1634 domain-containing protein [Candidatus Micrarchaeota archaeon]|nr:DUF1634 domain-containing protein [Candidatus Micrarchaeota archaeon]
MELEKAIGITLRIGVALSVVFILTGAFLLFLNSGNYSPDQIAGTTSAVNSSSFSFAQIISGLFHLDGISFILMGFMILIATPIARVLLSIFGFLFERNWIYVAITVMVFINLMVAIFVIPSLIAH